MATPSAFDLNKLFGKGAPAEQLLVWGVANQVLGVVLGPELQELQRAVYSALQSVPLSPADLADMVVRNIVGHGDAEAYAKQSGISPEDFGRLVHGAGQPLSLQELITALRRGFIAREGTGPDEITFEQGVAESRLFNKWRPIAEALGDQPIGPADAVDAVVEGQIAYDQGQQIAYQNGISPDSFRILVNTRGRPPSPSELAELLKRGFIQLEGTGPDATTFQQGIFEGATKDKWWQLYSKLADYVPPPRTVTAMVREGSLTDDQALQLYRDNGLTPELATAYLASAHSQKTQAERELTVSMVKALWQDGLVTNDQATQMLLLLNYSRQDVAWLLDLWQFEVDQRDVRTAIAKLHALYVAHKLSETQVSTDLDGLGVPPDGKARMLKTWALEREANVPTLTRAEIVDAWYYSVISQDEADQRLQQLGWSAAEAAILRGIRAHGKQPPAPAA